MTMQATHETPLPSPEEIQIAHEAYTPTVTPEMAASQEYAPIIAPETAGSDPNGEDWARNLNTKYASTIRAYSYRLVSGDLQAAEDIAQETLLRMWANRGELTGDSLRGFALTVARNLIIDRQRRLDRRPQEEMEPKDNDLVNTPDWDSSINSRYMLACILEGISPEHRTILVETYLRDKAPADVAKELGISLGTVKSRGHYAIIAARKAAKEQGHLAT